MTTRHTIFREARGSVFAKKMTPADFRAWRSRLGLSQAQAAAALDISARTVKRYELAAETALDDAPFPIPRVVALACQALESNPSA